MEPVNTHVPAAPGPDAVLGFECGMCGSCCRDDRFIVLTPQDIFSLSRLLGLSSGEFLAAHCDVERDAGLNGVPLAALRTPGGTCVFHRDNLCEVHAARPACCRNYPVGTRLEPGLGLLHVIMSPAPGCKGFGAGPETTVEQWWRDAGMQRCLPGINLLEIAARVVTRRLSPGQRDRLYLVLCDFDAMGVDPPTDRAQEFKDIYPVLYSEIVFILEHAPRLEKP